MQLSQCIELRLSASSPRFHPQPPNSLDSPAMTFTNPPFVAFVADLHSLPSSDTMAAIARIAPFGITLDHLILRDNYLPQYSECYVVPAEDDEPELILAALDQGATKVSAIRKDLSSKVPRSRLADASIPRMQITMETTLDDITRQFVSRLKSDRPDGLYATSVTTVAPASMLIGQVYSSKESIRKSIETGRGTYFSRSRNELWTKGETSGATQQVVNIRLDCDSDAVEFVVRQQDGTGFCHTGELSCFGRLRGFGALESVLKNRLANAPEGSYTKRLFSDEKLLRAKILEEASELSEANTKEEVAAEMADVLYFTLARCISKGVGLEEIERVLDERALKLSRRPGDAKPQWLSKVDVRSVSLASIDVKHPPSLPSSLRPNLIQCKLYDFSNVDEAQRSQLLQRPLVDSASMISRVTPIIDLVKTRGDEGLLKAISQFDKCSTLTSPVIKAPFSPDDYNISPEVKEAIDQAYENIHLFHLRQLDKEREPMVVETMPGVVCSRFVRPIERVGLYVPGGTAVLPSTALMLAIPAQVAGCQHISIATPPRLDGSISPEITYIAQKCGVKEIIKAGGAQAIASLAYGTKSVTKVDKIFGPGNQYVTASKLVVSSDTSAFVSIDMPAGPSEVLVIADSTALPHYVASDLLSQAEHGVDSQVILLAINLSDEVLNGIQREIDSQARKLSRVDIVRESIAKSVIVRVKSLEEAFEISNEYAPEHLILHLANANECLHRVQNAGSVFVGPFSPESCGDYASGTNHSLPTMKFAKQYSGVSTLAFMKHITSQELTKQGLQKLGKTVIKLAEVEGLQAHANAVKIRLLDLNAT